MRIGAANQHPIEALSCESPASSGTAQPGVNASKLKSLKIPLPPLAEQRRIAAILDKADAIRRKRQEAIALTEELLRSAFLEMFGDPVTNPKGWPKRTIASICTQVVDCPHSTPKYTDDDTELYCVRSPDIQAGYFDFSNTRMISRDEFAKRTKRLLPRAGDIVYCREGARLGNAAIVPSNIQVSLGQRMMLFRVDSLMSTSTYLWGVLNSKNIYRRIWAAVGGSAAPHVNVGDMNEMKIPLPPIDMTRRFQQVAANAESIREKQLQAIRQADNLFHSLVQRAFRGEL